MRLAPGISIVDVPPPAGDGLPVMDVAVFVGFAERGPLDRPVAIEDPAQYAAVFGGALDLVPRLPDRRDLTEPPPMQRAHLPAAVASFFAGGGRRCYVIRVAGDAGETLFPVSGLRLATRCGAGHPWQLAAQDFSLRSASPGAWADRHELAVRLRAVALRADDAVQRGDVLRVRRPAPAGIVGWLRVAVPATLAGTLAAATAADWLWTPALAEVTDEATDEATNNAAADAPDAASPPAMAMGTGGSAGADTATNSPPPALPGSPPASVDAGSWLIERVRVDLALRQPGGDESRREDCGLSAGAANLPWFEADAAGRFDDGENLAGIDWPLAGIAASALAALADGPDGDDSSGSPDSSGNASPLDASAGDWMLLPVAGGQSFGPWRAGKNDGRDALSRNGLAAYTPELFADRGWQAPRMTGDRHWQQPLRGDRLLRWADDIRFFADTPRRLGGLHGALGGLRGSDDAISRDATWIAVPDAVHPGWQRSEAPPRRDGRLVATPDEACNDASATAFGSCLPPPPRIPLPPRFDLAALRPGGEGSNALAPADAAWCIDAEALNDADAAASSPPGARVSFELQIAQRADFADARPLAGLAGEADESPQWQPLPGQCGCPQPPLTPGPRHFAPARYALTLPAGLHFLRARSWRDGRYSAWSAAAEVLVRASGWQLLAEQGGGVGESLAFAVHSALLDLCAATREHFALLSLPEHWDGERLARHSSALRAYAASDFVTAQAASFAAIHHPWLLRREAASASAGAGTGSAASGGTTLAAKGAGELHAHPPEGALLGLFAQRSRNRGAWAAAGFETLAEAFALAGTVPAEAIEAAFANPIEVRPRGIAATRACTLSDDVDWESIGVRRLFILLRRLARREGERYVFEANDLTLRRSLERSFDALLQRLMQRGAFRGASADESYRLRTASGTRASEEIERGECSLEIRVAPSRPLRFLTLRVLRAGEQLSIEEG